MQSQTLGGNAVFNFVKLPNTPQLTALGGVNVSQTTADAGLAFNNPSLLKPSLHSQLNAVFSDYYAGIKIFHLSGAYHAAKLQTTFGGGIHYFNYGSVAETDASGNVLGKFRPTDWVVQVSAASSYLQKWSYGATIKFISSSYGQYRSNGVAADMGVLYHDSSALFSASVLVKNIGFQVKKYPGTEAYELPFDLQAGITKRLKEAPFSFSLTAQKVHRFDIRYNDTAFNNANGFTNAKKTGFSAGKLLDHLVFASTLYLGNRIDIQVGYNFLRRRELNIGNAGNGLNGFSAGAGCVLGKVTVRYARAYLQSGMALNQFGLLLKLDDFL